MKGARVLESPGHPVFVLAGGGRSGSTLVQSAITPLPLDELDRAALAAPAVQRAASTLGYELDDQPSPPASGD